jgi:polyisoprenyl-teichoic acid--peptidoglycan teichoic acid transferase
MSLAPYAAGGISIAKRIMRGILEAWVKRRYKIGLFALGGILLIGLACLGLYSAIGSVAPVAAHEEPTTTPTPFLPATRTPTPFLPVSAAGGIPLEPGEHVSNQPNPAYTATLPLDSPPWSPYAGPIYPADTPIPKPVKLFDVGPDVMNIALLGTDLRPQGSSYRTDTIMILSLNRAKKTAGLISFPRDLYVYIPAYGMQRINVAFPAGYTIGYPGGSFALFNDMMKYNFGLPIHHYVLVNFNGFTGIINALGGIDVYAAYAYTDISGHGTYTVYAGPNHMNGTIALWYVRARHASSDFDRERRQQEVIMAIMQKLLSMNVFANFGGFYSTLSQYVTSDISLDMLTPYLETAAQVSPAEVRRYTIVQPAHVHAWVNASGADVLLPDYDAIHGLIESALQ